MTRLSLRAAIDEKCHGCGAADAGSNWREYIAVCPCTDCPLWSVRPLPSNAAPWMRHRDPALVPADWKRLTQEEALATMRGSGTGVTAILSAEDASPATDSPDPAEDAETDVSALLGGVFGRDGHLFG